jgi:hypothetical protein
MADSSFSASYADVAERLGADISATHAVPENELAHAERRLGVGLPRAVREYYAVLGAEAQLNRGHNRLIPVNDLEVAQDHIAFLEENQAVVFWAFRTSDAATDDPPVYQCPNVEHFESNLEHDRCSNFLSVMLVWQAAMGGLPFDLSSAVPASIHTELSDWTRVGTVQELTVYVRDRVALAVLPWDDEVRAFLASSDKLSLEKAARALGLDAE